MADLVFNIAKGKTVELYNRVKSNDPANSAFIIVLLKVTESDATLKDRADLGAVLVNNTEADFTNYARKTLTDADLAALPAPDYTNDRIDLDLPDQTYTSAGGASNNTLTTALICYDSDTTAGTDANIIPIAAFDYARTTDGSNLPLTFNSAGFYRAS